MAIRVTQQPIVSVDSAKGNVRVTQFPGVSVDQAAGKIRVTQFAMVELQSVVPGTCSSSQPVAPCIPSPSVGAGDDVAGRIVVHDFEIGGEGYDYHYSGPLASPGVFVRDPGSIISMRDANQVLRLWATAGGAFFQTEDGSNADNLSSSCSFLNYNSDYITLLNFSTAQPNVAGFEFAGDTNVVLSHDEETDLTIAQLNTLAADALTIVEAQTSRFRIDLEQGTQFMLVRVQLVSHPADGSLDLNQPPHIPLETYGRIWVARPEMGALRQVGGTRP